MPIDPSIALQARVPQVQNFDPMQTLMTVAQLRAMQEQSDLRAMQAAQLRQGLAEYQNVQGIVRQWQGGSPPAQPGMVSGAQLQNVGMPQDASLYGQPSPGTQQAYQQLAAQPGTPQAAMVPPATPGTNYVQHPRFAADKIYPDIPMAQQVPPDTAFQKASAAMQPAAMQPGGVGGVSPSVLPMPPAQPVPGMAPQAPQQAPQAPQQSPQAQNPWAVPPMAQLERRLGMAEQLMRAGPQFGIPMAKEMMALSTQELAARQQMQDAQYKAMSHTAELLASVTDQSSLDEARSVLGMMRSPLAQQIGGDFADPRTQAQLAYWRTSAQTQQQRVQAQIDQDKNTIEAFKARTEEAYKRADIGIKGGELGVKQYEAGIKGGELGVKQQQEKREEFDAMTRRYKEMGISIQETPNGIYAYYSNPAAVQSLGGAPALPGTPTGQPGVSYLGQSKEQVAPLRAAEADYLKNATTAADAARETKVLLNNAKEYIKAGILEAGAISNKEVEYFEKYNAVPPKFLGGPDEGKFVNTMRLRQIGYGLPLASQGGRIAAGMSDNEWQMLQRAMGGLSLPVNIQVASEAIKQMEDLADAKLNKANEALERAKRGESPLPTFQAPAPSSPFLPNQRQQGGLKPPAQQAPARVLSEADIQATMASSGKSRAEILAAAKAQGWQVPRQ